MRPLLSLLLFTLFFSTNSWAVAPTVDRLTIADSRGAWNVPAPYSIKRGPGLAYASLVFDTLVWKDQEGKLRPALATSWSFDPEKNSYLLTLNSSALWHDGRPVTADDVVFTVDYTRKHLYPFTNTTIIDRAEKRGAHQVEIFLKKEFVPFLSEIAGTLPILPAHIYQNIKLPRQYSGADASIGSGPYRLQSYDKSSSQCLLAANEKYYGGTPLAKEIAILKMPPPVAVEELMKGNISMIRSVPYRFLDTLKNKGISTVSSKSGHPVRLLFNHKSSVFTEKNLRHAVAYAINRQELVSIGLQGGGVVENTGGISFANSWHTTGLPQYAQNYDRAAELFRAAGYRKNAEGILEKNGKPFTVALLTAKPLAKISKIIASQLRRAGLNVEQRVVSRSALDANLDTFSFDMALFMSSALGDPVSFARRVQGEVPHSDRFMANDELTEIFKSNVTVRDTKKRYLMVARAQQIYAEELPAYYLYMDIWSTASTRDVNPFYTPGGILQGVPLPLNKLIFLAPVK